MHSVVFNVQGLGSAGTAAAWNVGLGATHCGAGGRDSPAALPKALALASPVRV